MSRGLGKVERFVLISIAERPAESGGLTAKAAAWIWVAMEAGAAGVPVTLPTMARQESVRRALRSLERKGLIMVVRGQRYWQYYLTPAMRASWEEFMQTEEYRSCF